MTRVRFPIILLAAFLSGCSVWNSLTAYFNTYYNADRDFDIAETEIWAAPELRYVGGDYLAPMNIPPSARTKLTSVIEKCSKLLQYHPESGLVDDALMMIGKAYYYQGEYQKAERKFTELLEGYPKSGLALEARLMLARTYYRVEDRAQSERVAKEVVELAAQEGEDDIGAHASSVLARLALRAGDFEGAREPLAAVAKGASNSDFRGRAYLILAEVDSTLGNFEAAEQSYRRAADVSSNYVVQYNGSLGAARMLAFRQEYDGALADLEEIRSNTNYREYFGEIDLEVADVYRMKGDIERAIEYYKYVDTAYARTVPAASALFELGNLYEWQLNNLDSARGFYTRGKPIAPGQSPLAFELLRRSEYLTRYFKLKSDIAKNDSLIALAIEREKAADTTSAAPRDSTVPMPPKTPPVTSVSKDTAEARRANAMNELATLFYLSMDRPDSAAFWYEKVLAEHPNARSTPGSMYTLAEIYDGESFARPESADSLRREIVERYPQSDFAHESRRILGLAAVERVTDPADSLYHVAEKMFLDRDYTGAAEVLESLVQLYPKSDQAPRAVYALGYLYEYELQLPDSAFARYQMLVRTYPRSTYAQSISAKVSETEAARRAAEQARAEAAKADTTRKSPAQQQGVAGTDTLAVPKPPAQQPAAATPDTTKKSVLLQQTAPQGTGRRGETPPTGTPAQQPQPATPPPSPVPPPGESPAPKDTTGPG